MYSTPVPNVGTLKARITPALAPVTTGMLENTWREIEFRLDVLQATKGAHVKFMSNVSRTLDSVVEIKENLIPVPLPNMVCL